MEKVTQSRTGQDAAACPSGDATPAVSPLLMKEAVRVFLALGITAADLRLRARPGSAVTELAAAMEMQTGAR